MREPPDHPPQDRRRRRVRDSQCRPRRGSQSGGAADAGDSSRPGPRGRTDIVLQPIPVAPKSAALDRFRGGAAAAADRKTLQALAARPLLGRQDVTDFVTVGLWSLADRATARVFARRRNTSRDGGGLDESRVFNSVRNRRDAPAIGGLRRQVGIGETDTY